MKVHIQFFATLRNYFHKSEQEIEFSSPQSAKSIFKSLFDDQEIANRFLPSVRFAVNCEYVPPETLVNDGDELALIPPVSGG